MRDKDKKTILVTGATGKQGGAVARHLINHGWHVRILARDTNKPSVQTYIESGAEIVRGNLDDKDSVLRAAKRMYGIFSVQANEGGPEVEFRQGKTLADVGRECGVKHFVYASVGSADRNTGIPFFDSKWQIEEYIRSLNLPATIFRPVFFMENFLWPQIRSSILEGTLSLPIKPGKPLQMIAVDNIGGFVATAFENPDKYICQSIGIAGDELTMYGVAQKLSRVIDRKVRYVEAPIEQMRNSDPDHAKMFQWFNDYGFDYDIPKLRETLPDLMDFETWLHKFAWEHLAREEAAVGARR